MIIEDIRVRQDPPQSNVWNGIFRMSSIGGCDAALIAIQQNVPALGGTVTPAMKEGLLHEMDIVIRLKAAGYKLEAVLDNQEEVTLTYPHGVANPWPIVGHPDGRIWGGNLPKDLQYILEVKSMSAFIWPRLKMPIQEAFPVYYGQAQFYLHSYPETWIPAVLWVAKNRSSGELSELVIRRDPEYMDNRLAAVSAALKHVADGDPPSSLPCSSSDYVRKYCPYRYMCDSGSFGKESAPRQVVTDNAAREAAALWREGKAAEVTGKLLIDQARVTLGATLQDREAKSVMVEGLLCQMVDSGRTSYDMKIIEPHVPEDVLAEARKESSWTSLRVTDKES